MYLKDKLVQLLDTIQECFSLNYKENESMPKVDWASFASMLATESLASPALPPSSCAHMKTKDRKIVSTVNWTWVRIFKRKKNIHH